jgi:hypothetical protein
MVLFFNKLKNKTYSNETKFEIYSITNSFRHEVIVIKFERIIYFLIFFFGRKLSFKHLFSWRCQL